MNSKDKAEPGTRRRRRTGQDERRRTALVYIRVRDTERRDPVLVKVQRDACRRLARIHCLDIAGEYVDQGLGTTQPRPGYEALKRRLERGDVTHIAVTSPDRLTRSLREWVRLVAECERDGVQIVLPDQKRPSVQSLGTNGLGW
jgi:DNA invertase Pin-like site-specific DNA recombinase